MQYSEAFKRRMVQKLCEPNAPTASTLARQEGVSNTSLSRWRHQADILWDMKKQDKSNELNKETIPTRPQDWSLEEKLQTVLDAAALSDKELGAYLRRKGLHEGTLEQWRSLASSALGKPPPKNKKSRAHKKADKRVKKLERELKRKNAALAETAALLVLKKKAQAIWGDEDDDTTPKSGK